MDIKRVIIIKLKNISLSSITFQSTDFVRAVVYSFVPNVSFAHTRSFPASSSFFFLVFSSYLLSGFETVRQTLTLIVI